MRGSTSTVFGSTSISVLELRIVTTKKLLGNLPLGNGCGHSHV